MIYTSRPTGSEGRLTNETYWDDYWRRQVPQLPVQIERRSNTLQINAVLDVLDAYLALDRSAAALEIGGAPGQYLAYLHHRFGCRCVSLDSSAGGCALTRKNFELLGVSGEVYLGDVFDPTLELGLFDLVYSLGLIEHFADVGAAVSAHVRYVRPGGRLILGVPNLQGVNRWFAKRLAPRRLASHNPEAMSLQRWDQFEAMLGLQREFRGYVGGFEPGVFATIEERTPSRIPIWALARFLRRTVGMHFPGLRRFNHASVSGYILGIWRVPEPACSPYGPCE